MEWKTYPLVALQLNVSPGTPSRGDPRSATKGCSRFLIREFIKRTRKDLLPDPAFVALHDNVTTPDCSNIIRAFKDRDPLAGGGLIEFSHNGISNPNHVRLLYNSKILRHEGDDRATLTPLD